MSRRKRPVRDDGMMVCKPIKEDPVTWHAVHIADFYRASTEDGVYWTDPESGTKYGRPSGYCKDCQKDKARGRYRPKRSESWFDGTEEEVLKEYDEGIPEAAPHTVQVIKEQAGKMGPPKVYERLEPITDLSFLKDA